MDTPIATRPPITATDALYGFAAWLTCRDEPVTLGARHNAAPAANLVEAWCKANNLPEPSEHYPGNIRHPVGPWPSGEESQVEPQVERPTFRGELESLVNRHSMENGSNTPDYMLADYLVDCLKAFDKVVRAREAWYGRNPARGPAGIITPVVHPPYEQTR